MEVVGFDTRRLLLVGTHAVWIPVAREAAARLGLSVDEVPKMRSALARMLRPDHLYDYVLAVAPLTSRAIDTLAGMLDEVTRQPTSLLLLGCSSHSGANAVACVAEPDVGALCDALTELRKAKPMLQTPFNPRELVAALHGGGLRMRFQPILRATDFQPIGVEALARVHTRERGIMHPKDFIPATVAARRERVLTGIAAARTFLEIGGRLCNDDLFVSINVPLVSVLHNGALLRAQELCAVADVSPSKVLVEVLESRTAPDFDLLHEALDAWHEAGFKTAIDDAGPALPHWRELLNLPFDVLKIDGALVADPDGACLLRTIVDAARARGRFIVAEGIEDETCLARIRPLGVDALQGFLFARPLPAMALPLWLEHWAARDQTEMAA